MRAKHHASQDKRRFQLRPVMRDASHASRISWYGSTEESKKYRVVGTGHKLSQAKNSTNKDINIEPPTRRPFISAYLESVLFSPQRDEYPFLCKPLGALSF